MKTINNINLFGRIGQTPELKTTSSGVVVCKFSVATESKRKNGNEFETITHWHQCAAFGKLALLINDYVCKGDRIIVQGELNYSKYEKDGVERKSAQIIVNTATFVETKKEVSEKIEKAKEVGGKEGINWEDQRGGK